MPDIDLLSRHFLGLYFLLIGIHYTATSLGLWRRTGHSAVSYGATGSATWWYRHTFNLFRGAILGVCLARIVWPIDPWLGVFPSLYQPIVLLTGMALLLVSFGLIDYVHSYMHQDWRTGIETRSEHKLLTQGPFARSRNPLFISIIIGQIGFFLALPSVFSLICLLVGVSVIVLQARQEEQTLTRHYGEQYTAYCRRVRRWL